MAILAKASMSVSTLRPGFDVSIPLFHKNHPQKGGEAGSATTNNFPANKRYLLAFKGKRYVHGIGSETRNALFHLHNEEDIILVTTCRHGKSWKEMKDDRCDEDNAQYDRSVRRVGALLLVHHSRLFSLWAWNPNLAGSCHKRQKPRAPTPQAPIRNRQTRKVANAIGLNCNTNLT